MTQKIWQNILRHTNPSAGKQLIIHFTVTTLAVFLATKETPALETWISFLAAMFLAFFPPF
ncbi:MAG: hypothetical protein FWF60_02050 [Oscillospiraceae bacterium]|nr:hypothetical protein [Oscillospiraceae bacterium]